LSQFVVVTDPITLHCSFRSIWKQTHISELHSCKEWSCWSLCHVGLCFKVDKRTGKGRLLWNMWSRLV